MHDATVILRQLFFAPKIPVYVKLRQRFEKHRVGSFLSRQMTRICDLLPFWKIIGSKGHVFYSGRDGTKQLFFNGRNGQFSAIYDDQYRNGYEFETSLLLLRLCRGKTVFYDIGSNWGYFESLLGASPWFDGSCYAFEPNPATFADLVQIIRDGGLERIAKAVNFGIGSEDGELLLSLPDRFKTGLATLGAVKGVCVPVKRIDSLDFSAPTVIKVDAEGMELEVFVGAEQTLRNHMPFLLFESFLDFEEPGKTMAPLRFLSDLGYELFNPTSQFTYAGCEVTASYGDPFGILVEKDQHPKTILVPLFPKNRFLMRKQINVFACHKCRLAELKDMEIELFSAV